MGGLATTSLLATMLAPASAEGASPVGLSLPTTHTVSIAHALAAAQAAAAHANPKSTTAGKAKASPVSRPRASVKVDSYTAGTHTVQTLSNGKATTSTELFARPTYRQTKAGWTKVSGQLSAGVGVWAVQAPDAVRPTSFGASPSHLLKVTLPKGSLQMSLVGGASAQPTFANDAKHQNHTVRYSNVAPSTDLLYDVHGAQVKEQLVLQSASAPTAFTFHLSDPHKLLGTAKRTAFDGYTFTRDVADGIHLNLDAPLAWEKGSTQRIPGSAHQVVVPSGDGFDVTLSVDAAWLSNKTFPVVLDPTLTYAFNQGTLASAYAPIGATACSGGPCPLSSDGSGSFVVSNLDPAGPIRAYFHSDLSNIPASTHISGANFALGFSYAQSPDLELHAVTQALGVGATGADLAAATDPTVLGTIPVQWSSDTTTKTVDITSVVRSWINQGQGAAAGLTLKLADESTPEQSYATTNFSAPSIVINYNGQLLPPPIPVEQGYGCDCRWGGGASVTNKALDPINTAAGAVMERNVDLSLAAAPGIAATMGRTLNGADSSSGPLGAGWTDDFNATLTQDATSGDVSFRDPTGGIARFRLQTDGTYLPATGITSQLVARAAASGGGWTLTALSGEQLTFSATGQLIADVDRTGKGITLAYASGRLSTVTDALGQTLTMAYGTSGAATGLTTDVTASDGRAVHYGYTTIAGTARLTSVTGTDSKTTTYSYDSTTGALTGISDPNNHTSGQNLYDATTGRVKQQKDATGATWQLGWDAGTQTQTITDPNGGVSKDVYYGNVLIKHVDQLGNTTSYFYDGALNLVATVDPRGNETDMTYDGAGHMLTRTAPAPLNYQESWTYDSAGRVHTYTDGRQNTTTYTYDAAGRVSDVQDRTGGHQAYTYAPNGLVGTSKDALNHTTTYGYDAANNLTSETDAIGNITTMTYDSAHRMLTRTDPRGNVPGCNCAATYTSSWTYDGAGRVLTSKDALGRTTTNTYDNAGNLVSHKSPRLNTTTKTYDADNRLLTVTDPKNHTTTYSYDAVGNLLTTTDATGRKTSNRYDAANRLVATTSPAGNVAGATAAVVAANTTTYSYDAASNQTSTSQVDPNSSNPIQTTTAYDVLNRPWQVTDPLGHQTTTTYDEDGNVTSTTDPTGVAVLTDYDAENRPLDEYRYSAAQGYSSPSSTTYDAAGRVTQRSDALGNTTTYGYDDANRLTSQVDPRGNVSGCNCAATYRTTYGYDPAGNRTSTTDPLGNATGVTYDAANQDVKTTNQLGRATTYGYNDDGQLNRVATPAGSVTQYSFDTAGRLTQRKDPRLQLTTYGYDNANRLTQVTNDAGQSWVNTYDSNGALASQVRPSGTSTPTVGDGTISYQRDALGRVSQISYSDGTPTIGLTYDAASRVTQMTDGLANNEGPVNYAYDDANRLTSRSRNPVGGDATGFAYGYDGYGRLAARTYPDGTVIAYTQNDADQVTRQVWAASTSAGVPGDASGPGHVSVTYAYDPMGNLNTQTSPNNVSVTDTYDAADRLVTTLAKRGTGTISKFDQTLDKAGNPTVITTRRGTAVSKATYTYDQDSRLTQVCYASPCLIGSSPSPSISYGYDANDNRISENRVGVAYAGARNSTYNDLDQITQVADSSGNALVSYGYDMDGHQVSSVATANGAAAGLGIPSGSGGTSAAGSSSATYNLADQLATFSTVLTSGGSVNLGYTYDGDGNRATKAINGLLTTKYVWDANNSIPELSAETAADGSLQRRHIEGMGGEVAQSTVPTDSADLWLLQDPQQNTSDILDSSGNSSWSATYEPFGAIVSSTAASSPAGQAASANRVRFDGQYYDDSVGLYNNRARNYDVLQGRFTGNDPRQPRTIQGASSAYSYVGGRPLVQHDPTGQTGVPLLSANDDSTSITAATTVGAALGLIAGAACAIAEPCGLGAVAIAGVAEGADVLVTSAMVGTTVGAGAGAVSASAANSAPAFNLNPQPQIQWLQNQSGGDTSSRDDPSRGVCDEGPSQTGTTSTQSGPGRWELDPSETMSDRAAAYQARVTGAAKNMVYRLGNVKFDGYSNGELQDAKGPGYASLTKNGVFRPGFKVSDDLAEQAVRQLNAANGTPITWYIAEPEAFSAIENLFADRGIYGISLVWLP